MILDIVCLGGVLFFLVGGVISGFLRQVVRLVALCGAFLLVSPLGGVIGRWLSGLADVTRFPGNMLVMVLAWLAGYLAILLAGLILLRVVRGVTPAISGPDRALGGALGMLKGGLIVYVAVTILLLFQEPVKNVLPEASGEVGRSRVAEIVNIHNPLLGWMREVQGKIRRSDLGANLRALSGGGDSTGSGKEAA